MFTHPNKILLLIFVFIILMAQNSVADNLLFASPSAAAPIENATNSKIVVKPAIEDQAIANRINKILKATHWYINPTVNVKEGIVFLNGQTDDINHKKWAENLARNIQDTVAVVNQIQVNPLYSWNYQSLRFAFVKKINLLLQSLPLYGFALLILSITLFFARSFKILAQRYAYRGNIHPLLTDLIIKSVSLFLFLIGFYLILQLMGWTTIALTILGGTGLLGIILGMAFRDIAENLLASILLSIQRPFKNGDLIQVENITGFVEKLTLRATVLITADGNHVQIPNSTIYKAKIFNYTSNPQRREEFTIPIGYECNLTEAQENILSKLKNHPAVLSNPEPTVLVDNFGSNEVVIKVYFWFDGCKYQWQKIRSAVMRLAKESLEDLKSSQGKSSSSKEQGLISAGEGQLESDTETIKKLAKGTSTAEAKNLLNNSH